MDSETRASTAGVGQYWVLIETGSNQDFIFSSNKQVVNVGASYLITRVGESWVPDAVRETGTGIETVVCASGKALLLVDSPETGKKVIRSVTSRALREAPGLEIWGVVDSDPIRDERDLAHALTRAHRLHAARRSLRPAAGLRYPTLPFTQPCRYSGQPAVTIERESANDVASPRSRQVDLAWKSGRRGRNTLAKALRSEAAVVKPDKLNDGVRHAGWVAILHADGNGIGGIFKRLGEHYSGETYLQRLQEFSEALDDVTKEALRAAVRECHSNQPDDWKSKDDWLLPLVLGGDDVTAVMDARMAYDLTVTFLRKFALGSREDSRISEVTEALGLGRGLTAAAGIAFVKPHHSFAEGYSLAGQLCRSAKRVKDRAPGCNALDFHVLHDSVGSNLNRIRDVLRTRDEADREAQLWGGPFVVPTVEDPAVVSRWGDLRHHRRLEDAMTDLTPSEDREPVLSQSQAHEIRNALFHPELLGRTRQRIEAWAPEGAERERVASYLAEHLLVGADADADVADAGTGAREPERFSRILSAIDLIDVRTGTEEGRAR